MSARRRLRATTLVTALIFSSLAFIAISLVAAWASAQSVLGSSVETRQRAKALAEAAIHRALAAACQDSNFSHQTPASWEIDDGLATGCLSFETDWAKLHRVPLSTDNLMGMASVPGSLGQPVPPHCLQLLGVGRCGQVTVQVNSVVYRGGYPFVIASQGPVLAQTGLLVGSLDPNSPDLGPGDMVTNSGQQTAVQLGPACVVTGDVRASGGIVLDPQAVVKGQTLPNSAPVQIPQITLSNFLPSTPSVLGSSLPGQTLVGPCLSNQALTVYGDLRLDGASLYVKGDLSVQGSIRGRGLVVSEGNLTVSGGADMASFDQAVLLSGGDVLLQGADQAISRFQGLVYSQGSFRAQNISLVGVFISRGTGGTTLNSVRVTPNVAYTRLDLSPLQGQSFDFSAVHNSGGGLLVGFAAPTGTAQAPPGSSRFSVKISVQAVNTPQGLAFEISDPSGNTVQASSAPNAVSEMRSLAQKYFQKLYPGMDVSIIGQLNNLVSDTQSRTMLAALNQMTPSGSTTTGVVQVAPAFDLSQFLSPEANMRILSWRVQ